MHTNENCITEGVEGEFHCANENCTCEPCTCTEAECCPDGKEAYLTYIAKRFE